MKKLTLIISLCLFTMLGWAQKNEIEMVDILNGKYTYERISGINPLNDGENYSQINNDKKRIIKKSFETGKETGVIFDAATARNKKIESIDGYIMSPDESRILIQTDTKAIYRRSFTAQYYIYTVKNNTLEPLSNNGAQQVPKFSPDGNCIAFVRDNNIFLVKLLFNNSESQVTTDGKKNAILNGIPDWVNEEEFGYNCAYDFSSDSQMIAFIRFDETQVPTFEFPLYKGMEPELKAFSDYPGSYEYKYPIAGMTNSTPTVQTFDIKSHVIRKMDLPIDADGYIAGIQFTQDPEALAILTLNRHQDRFSLYMGNPRSRICKMIYRDEDSKYINEAAYRQIKFYKDNFAVLSERDGYQHLYWYTIGGTEIKKVTTGDAIVNSFYGYDEATKSFYYSATDGSPLRTAIFRTDLKGKTVCLSSQKGTNSAIFSKDFEYFINTYSNIKTPPVITSVNNSGKTLRTLISNNDLKNKLNEIVMPQKELFNFTTQEGITLNGWMMKPTNFDSNHKYKVLMYQYGGPGSQEVTDSWFIGINRNGGMWESFLCSQGYIVVCVDGRGTGNRGAAFEKDIYLNLGVKEAKDQVETAIWLGKQSYIDKDNIAIWGWSFGGFNTLMSMSEGRDVFKAGIAVAPPTCWKYYDSIYTERYMRTPKENALGYNECPIGRASRLSGKLLLIHGLADDNVHFRNTAEYSEALVQAGKQFQMQIYTNRNHGIRGGNTTLHLFTRITNFLNEELK